jgi:hypothetical protein
MSASVSSSSLPALHRTGLANTDPFQQAVNRTSDGPRLLADTASLIRVVAVLCRIELCVFRGQDDGIVLKLRR